MMGDDKTIASQWIKPQANTSDERLVRIIEEHWIKYVAPGIVYIGINAGGLLLLALAGILPDGGNFFADAPLLVGILLLFIAHHWFFAFLLGEAIDCIIITNKRTIVFETKLLVHDDMVENTLEKVRSVEVYQDGILQNVLLYGSLRFQGGTDIHLVPHPHRAAKEIEQAMGRI